jgi:hypothetical protein
METILKISGEQLQTALLITLVVACAAILLLVCWWL